MEETLKLMLDLMMPEDHPQDDTEHHKAVRRQVERPINTTDDKEFTHEKVKQVIEGFKSKEAPGPNGNTNEILKLIFKAMSKTMTALYNECLRKGCFSENWKIAKILPIIVPGKEYISDPSKYRTISRLNTEGKVLEKLLIRRIMHYLYKTDFLNNNQYGFTPQKSTVDAAMEVRQFIELQLERRGVVITANLDVKGAFGLP